MSKQEQERFNPFMSKPLASTKIGHVIAIASGKGGVGKSMVTGLIANSLNQMGFKVGILDGDITGPSIGKMFNITSKASGTNEGMRPAVSKNGIQIISANMLLEDDSVAIAWRGPMIGNAVKEFYTKVVWNELDYLLIDMPPGTGDVPLTVYQSFPVDGIVMVTTPQELVSMVVLKAITMAQTSQIRILGLIENMSYIECPKCGEVIYPFGQSRTKEFASKHNLNLLGQLPIQSQLVNAADSGTIDELSLKDMDKIVKDLIFDLEK